MGPDERFGEGAQQSACSHNPKRSFTEGSVNTDETWSLSVRFQNLRRQAGLVQERKVRGRRKQSIGASLDEIAADPFALNDATWPAGAFEHHRVDAQPFQPPGAG